MTRAGVWGRSGRDQNKGDGRGGAGGKLTLGVVAGPRKMGVQGKLSHLSLSISTWHLGRASDQEAAYPCGPAGPVPAPAQPRRGRLAGPLCCQKPPRPPAAPTQPLGEAGAPCLEPRLLSPRSASATHPVALLSGLLRCPLDVHVVWTLARELGFAERCVPGAPGGFGPWQAGVLFLPAFHGVVRGQPRGPYGITPLECGPSASGRDDLSPRLPNFLLYQFLLCSCLESAPGLCFWPATGLC